MREAFTRTLRQVMGFAQQEARERHQEFVGTEHLFLAVMRCRDCEAETALRQMGLNPEKLREAILKGLPTASEPPIISGDLPLSPKAQRIINAAIVKAQALREDRITTRFLLLSLVDEPQTLIRDVLEEARGDVNLMRQALVESPADDED